MFIFVFENYFIFWWLSLVNSKYLLSYTAVSLQAHEAETIAELYKKTLDWGIVEQQVIEERLLREKESL